MTPGFVHLRLHTEYSLHDGLIRVKPLARACAEGGMAACAVTDLGNLFALVKFYRAATDAGIKPIIGVDFRLHNEREPSRPGRLLVLCQNIRGYRNLAELVTRCYTDARHHGEAMLDPAWLDGKTDGLLALSGGSMGDVGQALLLGRPDLAAQRLDAWLTLFPERFYLEIMRTGRPGEEDYMHAAVALASRAGVPVVAHPWSAAGLEAVPGRDLLTAEGSRQRD